MTTSPQYPNRATNVPVTVQHAEGQTTVEVNQQPKPASEYSYAVVGSFTFGVGEAKVTVSNASTDGYVIVDAVQLVAQP